MANIVADRIKETTTTTGTGTLALLGAVTGYRAFSAVCANNDTASYAVATPGGAEWEVGTGTWTTGNNLARTTVLASSNAGALVSFSAGTKDVFLTQPASVLSWARERLTAARNYFVRTDGSDTNTGLGDTAATAFLTIQRAVDVIKTIDTQGYLVIIVVRDGTRTATVTVDGPLIGGGTLKFLGNTTTPANCAINTTSANCFYITNGARVSIRGFKMTTTTSGYCIIGNNQSYVEYGNNDFGACAGIHFEVSGFSIGYATFSYAITGGGVAHFHIGAKGYLFVNPITITITGTPNFTSYFDGTAGGYQDISGITFSGSATGKRYHVHKNGVIDVGVYNESFIPGSINGFVTSGGKYTGVPITDISLGKIIVMPLIIP